MKIKEFKTAFNTYTSIKGIGSGGSGYVLQVENYEHDIFALKYLAPDNISTKKLQRFKNELNFCYKNTHDNIIKVLDWGRCTIDRIDSMFYVMPYYDKTLRILIKEGIKHQDVLKYFSNILDGIEAGHLKGVYHRDIKPENILFDSKTGNLVIADFGIVHFNKDNIITAVETRLQERLANFQYAAPEQKIKDSTVNHKADIYALGMILNEMFTKSPPSGTDYKKVNDINPEYEYLDAIIESMMRQSADKRPSDIDSIKMLISDSQRTIANRQKLSKLKNEVIPKSEIDDEIIANPIKLDRVDYQNDALMLYLNQKVNAKWVDAFRNIGDISYIEGAHPNNFHFIDYRVQINVRSESNIPRIVKNFNNYLEKTSVAYKSKLILEMKEKEQYEKMIRKQKIQEEEKRLRIIESVKNL